MTLFANCKYLVCCENCLSWNLNLCLRKSNQSLTKTLHTTQTNLSRRSGKAWELEHKPSYVVCNLTPQLEWFTISLTPPLSHSQHWHITWKLRNNNFRFIFKLIKYSKKIRNRHRTFSRPFRAGANSFQTLLGQCIEPGWLVHFVSL